MDNLGIPPIKGFATMFLDQVFPEALTLALTQKPYPQSQDDSWSIHDLVFVDYDLFIGLGGAAVFQMDGKEFLVEPGTALLVPPGKALGAQKVSTENFQALAQHFDFKHLGVTDFFHHFQWEPLVRFSRWSFVRQTIDHYLATAQEEQAGSALVGHALFRTLVLEFAREAWTDDGNEVDPGHGFVFRMAREIEASLLDEACVERAVARAPVSPDYAGRLFRKQFGLSPSQYRTRCRIRAAGDLLLAGKSVKEASHALGYEDQLYFSRVFTKLMGMAPRDYR